jgi:sec-independent protein translocase protein TatB
MVTIGNWVLESPVCWMRRGGWKCLPAAGTRGLLGCRGDTTQRRGRGGDIREDAEDDLATSWSGGDCRVSFRGSMMKRVSFSETIFLFFLALVVFGPKKLPEIARQVGKMLNEFRRASNEFKSQIEQEIAHLEVESTKPKTTIFPPSSPPEGTASRSLSAGGELPVTLAGSADVVSESAAAQVAVVATEAIPSSDGLTSDAVISGSSQEMQPQETHPPETQPEPAQESHA